MLFASLLATAACSAAHADQPMGPMPPPGTAIAIGIAPAKIRAPYDVQVIREGGDTLPTYASRDRFYVQGNAGDRYIIRVTNPTANRVEAVVTIDGLDVIDGESGDLRKRGYVVPAYGDVRIEGFRTSQANVATFRFGSVNDSYAGQKGKARNVGVIAVAIFEEQNAEPEQQIIITGEAPPPPNYRRPYDYRDDIGADASKSESTSSGRVSRSDPKPAAKKAPRTADRGGESVRRPTMPPPADSPAPTSVRPSGGFSGGTGGAPVRQRRIEKDSDNWGGDEEMGPPPPVAQRNNRPGLGTEFGESRYSAASFTRFVRGNGRPIAIAELRYNNAAGLLALGINAEPLPDSGEIMTRETADPFPGDNRFSRPPR
jgi:hypothetical protein